MGHKKTIISLLVATAVFAGLLLLGLIKIDPRTTLWIGFFGITVALFLFLGSLIGTLLLAHRVWRKKNKPVAFTLRQASFFSTLVIVALYLQRFDLLTWWNVLLLIGIAVLAEMFFVEKEAIQS